MDKKKPVYRDGFVLDTCRSRDQRPDISARHLYLKYTRASYRCCFNDANKIKLTPFESEEYLIFVGQTTRTRSTCSNSRQPRRRLRNETDGIRYIIILLLRYREPVVQLWSSVCFSGFNELVRKFGFRAPVRTAVVQFSLYYMPPEGLHVRFAKRQHRKQTHIRNEISTRVRLMTTEERLACTIFCERTERFSSAAALLHLPSLQPSQYV